MDVKEKKRRFSWYTGIIVILVFGFSILCWKQFLSGAGRGIWIDEEENLSLIQQFDEVVTQLDDVWYEEIYWKKYLNAIHSVFVYRTLQEIPGNQVVAGKDNWLFYVEKIENDTLADYEGINRYKEEEMEEFLRVIFENQRQMEERGIQFVTLVAPNKENVYPEYMPDYYIHNPVSNTDVLVEYLKENGVSVVSAKEDMRKLSGQYQLYYPYDSHWNQLGAYVAAGSALRQFGISAEALENREIIAYPLKGNYHEGAWSDLANMSGLNYILDDEMEFEVAGCPKIDWNQYNINHYSHQISHYSNESAPVEGKVFLIGDSFRTAMVPAMCETYKEVYVIHRNDYIPAMLEEIQPDYVILEYVERYVNQMKDFRLSGY